MKLRLTATLLSLAVAAGFAAFVPLNSPGAQGDYSRSDFERTMESSNASLKQLFGSLLAADWAKAQSAAEKLAAQARLIRELTPKHAGDRRAEFRIDADSLIVRSERAGAAAKGHDTAAAEDLGKIVQTCMDCHQAFRR